VFLLLAAMCAFIAAAADARFPVPVSTDTTLVVSHLRTAVLPEPAESIGFIYILCVAPVAAMLLARVRWPEADYAWMTLPIGALFGWLLVSGELSGLLVHGWRSVMPFSPSYAVAALAAAAAVCLVPPCRAAALPIAVAHIIVAIIFQLSWRVVGWNALDADITWTNHAEIVFYVLSQVIAGGTVLANLPSQYGLFPEFLAPIFRIVAPTSFSITFVFAMLQLAGVVFLVTVLTRRVRNAAVLLVSGLALILVTGETVYQLGGTRELYLQYWPIRFFWPAAVVLAFNWYIEVPSIRRAALVSTCAGLGALWNMDSGLVCVAAFAAFLMARAVTSGRSLAYLHALVVHATVCSVLALLAVGMLSLKGGALHLSWWVTYQRTFAGLGLMALPLPREPHAWMAVVAVYLLALAVAADGWRRGATQRADLLFFLAVLGLGLFSYYVSRSHPLNLVKVLWPSVLTVALLCDDALTKWRERTLGREQLILAVVGLAGLAWAAGSLVTRLPHYTMLALDTPGKTDTFDTRFREELALMRLHAPAGSRCMVAASPQGVFQIEAGISSSVPGPSLQEAVLQADQDQLVRALQDGVPTCIFLGTDVARQDGFPISLNDLREKYRLVDRAGSMIYLQRK
jgi:hypothetical protein